MCAYAHMYVQDAGGENNNKEKDEDKCDRKDKEEEEEEEEEEDGIDMNEDFEGDLEDVKVDEQEREAVRRRKRVGDSLGSTISLVM